MANMMLDDDAFLASMGTQPHSQFGVVIENESFPTNQSHETCSRHTQLSGSTSLSPTTRKRNRGVNKIRFGQAIFPRDNVARFGRYIVMLARDGGIIPIDSPDWHKIKSSKLDRVWSLVQATIDWRNPRVAGKEEKRKHCNDSRVIKTQWQALVTYWDKIENEQRCATNAKNRKMLKTSHTTGTTTFAQIRNDYAEEHDGSEPDRVTFFKMTHIRGTKQLPVDDESARMMEKRNQVRGFGLGVGWVDVPGIVTEQRGISREVKYLRKAYEAQKQATAAAEEKMTRLMHEANEKAKKMKREQEESIQRLRAEQEENLRLAKVQMAEQLKAMLAHVGINIGSFGVVAPQSTST
ncbi:hypothetical protein ACFX1Q_040348 [Malus domestica]